MRIARMIFAGLWVAASPLVFAQPAPSRIAGPVSLVVPYPPGGASDITARILSGPLGHALGTQVIVENIGGASGGIAARKMLSQPADGRIIYQGSQNELILPPLTIKGTRYDTSDFEIVHPVTATRLVLVVRRGLPVRNLQEFVALAHSKSEVEPLTCGIPGLGSLYHLISDSLAQRAGLKLNFIPYKGSAPIVQDLLGDRVDFTIMAYSTTMMPFVSDGRYRIIANMSMDKPLELAKLMSISEMPVSKDMDFKSNAAYYVKKGTPLAIRQALNKALGEAVEAPAVIKGLEGDGRRISRRMSLADSEAFYRNEVAKFQQMVKTTGFQPIE